MRNQKNLYFSQMDFEFLMFLWKWKVATSRMFIEHFKSPKHSGEWGIYKCLLRLAKRKFIVKQTVMKPRPGFVWSLAERGFKVVATELPELAEAGYKCENPAHDIFVTACHLGPFINIKEFSLYTEQEMRRINHSARPAFYPERLRHRPDGLISIKNGSEPKTTAIEVELTVKSRERYLESLELYGLCKGLSSVLWIVKDAQVFDVIWRAVTSVDFHARELHQFVTLDDYLAHSLNAEIFAGTMRGQKVQSLCLPHEAHFHSSSIAPTWLRKNLLPLLDTRLKPFESTVYEKKKKPSQPDCIPPNVSTATTRTPNSSTKENLYVQNH